MVRREIIISGLWTTDEEKLPDASWRPWEDTWIIQCIPLVVFCCFNCLVFPRPQYYMHENRVFVWMMLLLFFPPTRNQFCSCEVAVVTVEMFVISEKICVRMCKLLRRWFLLCVLKGVRSLQNGRFWFQPLLTTSFNHLGWNFPGFVCLTLSFSGKLLQKLFTYFLK